MKFKKTLSLLLASVMVMGAATISANTATVDDPVGYSNQSYLETQASSAYNEQNLGSTYSPSSTTFKTWSPDASAVKVKLYKTGSDAESGAGVIGTYNMTKNSSTGVWSYTLSGDHKNEYYTYLVTVNGTTNETQDVYSRATGVNGNRTMIVDLDSTDPDDWENDKHVLFDNAGEAVVWEVHVRDFSISETSGVSSENQGKYLAFTEGGTTLNGKAGAMSTAIDYLVEQGINCVQLQPVYDFQSVDESIASSSVNRNWGYDPQNYNVPEGSYSSNPYDGNVRITEFKQMIQALHDRGISVVMDVVYNHTYNLGSSFERTAPKYYYRMTSNTVYSNGSGCGNETASDKKMYRKFMIESVKYWAEEYHIDGFRFDLMGLHDTTTMNEIRKALDNLYADGSGKKMLMYGEPWTGGTSQCPNPCLGWNGSISTLDSRVGMFCDSYRDAIKGDTDGTGKGFVQGNTSANTSKIVAGVKGKAYSGAKAPSQTIAYADAHDNLILWDKIVKSNGSSAWTGTTLSYQNQVKEVMTLLLTSQGIPFMTAGSEFGRTKQGDHNSYNSSDSINAIDWNRVKQLSGLASYYKGLLQIRKNYTPLHSANFVTPSFQSQSGDVVAYTYTNSKAGEWNKLCVLVNGGAQAWSINLSGSGWTIVASSDKGAGLTSLGTVSGSSYSVPAKGSVVLVDSASFNNLKVQEKFGTLTINHVDDKGTLLKTQTAKYREGNTYRAFPDSNILFDYNLIKTEGAVSGKVEADKNYTVTFTYSNAGIQSGYVNVSYVSTDGKVLRDPEKSRYRFGDSYSVPFIEIQGYQLDTEKYPANTKGTFNGTIDLKFIYKPLDNTTSTVHYKNTNGWSNVRCYAYYTDGAKIIEPNGAWNSAPVMTNDSSMGSGWLTATVKAATARVMFHTSSGTIQEPGQGEDGYLVSGEAWIENKVVTFSTKIITSHIDIATGKKISPDVVVNATKVKSTDTYTTSPLAGRTDYIAPGNASSTYNPGVVNVVYLYGESGDNPTDPTVPTSQPETQPTTQPTQPTTQPTQPETQPTVPDGETILIGDIDGDGKITVVDATTIQRFVALLENPTDTQKIASDTNGDGIITVIDATFIQKYLAERDDIANVGKVVGNNTQQPTTAPTEPTTEPVTDPVTEPTTLPVYDNCVYLNPSATSTGGEIWYAYTWTYSEEDSQWIAGIDEGGIYRFDNPAVNIIFVRMDPLGDVPSWDAKWNQTSDLITQLGGTYTTTGWGSGWGADLEGMWS